MKSLLGMIKSNRSVIKFESRGEIPLTFLFLVIWYVIVRIKNKESL